MSDARITPDGLRGGRPGREAPTGTNVPAGGGGPRRKRRGKRRDKEPEFRSYYDLPVINKPVWESPDIPGYLFLGGLAGAGALIGAAAHATSRPVLSRASKVAAASAGHLSLVALVHDLGRRGRFLNMLRVFKVTSPMSVGSWLLAGFVPSASVAALCDVTGVAPALGALTTTGSAVLGGPVAAYTAALISNTAVPAWHEGQRWMPFVFVSSGLSAASGLGLMAAPPAETRPLVPLAVGGGLAEVVLVKAMEERGGVVKEAYQSGPAKKFLRAAEILTVGGALLAATSGRSRSRAVAGGAALLAGSALTRFGIFHAGLISAEDPKYTVVPQRERLQSEADAG
ncbi:NrfD/PsrC family molybdoenzyme membrane anchor subunit [Streptomyces sp. SLBN-31]|uniref:NrfD/PsrC family molybdoenzyme membrane anchor subunit n=1 Tax=Streptomyces sp. SLBN-31 TaxID=2768444 RepID=UPI00115266CF|nr:NrfD/PsrC family molybdoenzyme membrane anchor subunit [Streptomyces sp. SLBN-31]TQJ91270.1 polysulfide reductase NrfD [Streptomyces sp. SLBN-31]